MPELPEVETVRRSLAPRLCGRRVEETWARAIRLRQGIQPEAWERGVQGARLESVNRRGKYLLFGFGETTAVIHLGMSGRMLVVAPGHPLVPHTHLVLRFEGDRQLRFVDPRRFGAAIVVATRELARLPALAALGPDPILEDAEARLVAAVRRSRALVRSILLDQHVLAGVGNIYANEALARAGIHPLRRGSAISARRVGALWHALREVLREAIVAGGTTLADGGFVDSDGNDGYFAINLAVYGREGEPCWRCGAAIRRAATGGRSTFYCSHCQR